MGWENKSNALVATGKKQVVSSDGSPSSGGWQRRYNNRSSTKKSQQKESQNMNQTEFYQSNIDRSMYEEAEYREPEPPKVVYVEKPVPVQQPAPVQTPVPVQQQRESSSNGNGFGVGAMVGVAGAVIGLGILGALLGGKDRR